VPAETGALTSAADRAARRLVIGITGAVSAAAMPMVLLRLRQAHDMPLLVLMSESACRFVGPSVVALHAGAPPVTDMFAPAGAMAVPHIEATQGAALFVVMPATANIIGKAAGGIADDLVSAAIMASACPLLFVPSMNGRMWANPAVQENVAKLRGRGHDVVEPVAGPEIADLQPTEGCMPPVSTLIAEIARRIAV
jgi:phosphopantothenoylcysteine decarboxylase/phosphopantothenate--cysteine ligase